VPGFLYLVSASLLGRFCQGSFTVHYSQRLATVPSDARALALPTTLVRDTRGGPADETRECTVDDRGDAGESAPVQSDVALHAATVAQGSASPEFLGA